ncbi:MAG TPA: 16S rRNA (guanine(527)-N(7))-methyltransferase RsmG [Sphingomonadaceae bacterium]|nr:16S rRNA (guanine(527)-N(7))-methyltransferase RsmG [Sphingomonadaceae bacterium]
MIANEAEARKFVARNCDAAGLARLERLVELLLAENRHQNLIAANSLQSLWLRHIADSLQLLAHVPREAAGDWLDLGTGAGFPGLVIAAIRPDLSMKLVESRRKRVAWLERARTELGLGNCQILGSRLELVDSFPAGVISARAFAPLPRLLDLSARFSTPATYWLLPKGRSAAQELAALPESQRKMFHVERSLTEPGAGIIVGHLRQEARQGA